MTSFLGDYILDFSFHRISSSRTLDFLQVFNSCSYCWRLLVFILYVFFLFLSGFNLYWWKGIHFSQNLDLIFLQLFFGLIISLHFWFRDLLREFYKKYEILLIIFFLVFLIFIISEALLFVSFGLHSQLFYLSRKGIGK